MTREKKIIQTSIIGILGNLLLVAGKATVGLIAGSVSIILDAVNNLSDALSSIVTIIGTIIANKKPDKKHPYGHGRVEYLTSFIVAVIILIAGGSAIYKSITSLINGETATYSNITLIIISVAIVVKIALGLYFRYVGKKVKSDALRGSGVDALFDALLSLTTLIGAIVAMFWNVYIEGYLGILIGLFIIRSGIEILAGAVSSLVGERTSPELAIDIKKMVKENKKVLGVYDLILNNYGPNRSVGSLHIEVDGNMPATEIHKLSRKISYDAYERFGIILTVGIYGSDPKTTNIRTYVYQAIRSFKEVKEIHAFFLDEDMKTISFDLIIDFSCKNPDEIENKIRNKIKEQFPEYEVIIVRDFDFAD